MKIPFFSVVSPLYNDEEVVAELCKRTLSVLEDVASDYELILVDDGSSDRTAERMAELHRENPHIKCLFLSRNFGQPSALSAGLDYARGDAVALIDSDLQDPPEVLPRFIEQWQKGYEVVYGVRTKRKESFFKRCAYWIFYRLFQSIAELEHVALDSGDFALLDRKVVLTLRSMPERSRFLRGLRSWVGYRQCGVEYERAGRFAGASSYTVAKLFRLAFDGLFSFSYLPLRFATLLGFFVALSSGIGILILLYMRLRYGVLGIAGFSSTLIVILFIGAVQLISIGILGEYIGRIYDEVRRRPLYVLKETLGDLQP